MNTTTDKFTIDFEDAQEILIHIDFTGGFFPADIIRQAVILQTCDPQTCEDDFEYYLKKSEENEALYNKKKAKKGEA